MDKVKFGKRIREIRIGMGLSQLRFGNMVGMSTGRIGDIETGNANLTLTKIEQLAMELNIPISKLFEDEDFVPAEPDAQVNEMVAIAKKLTPESKELVITLMKGLLGIQ